VDGGNTFIKIPEDIGESDVQVIADINYEENGIIYAATNEGVYRWSIGVSTTWQRIVKESNIAGLAVGSEGTLYALKPSEGVIRLLNSSTSNGAEFDFIDLPAGGNFPILRLSSSPEQNDLWTTNTANNIIYYLTDTLCKAAPTLDAPIDSASILPNYKGCYVSELGLSWLELPSVTTYEAAIYLDRACTVRVWLENSNTTGIVVSDNFPGLTAGTTYYWRTRSIAPLKSPWSEVRKFTVAVGTPITAPYAGLVLLSPTSGATDVPLKPGFSWGAVQGATEYEIIVAEDAALTNKVASAKITTTSFQCSRNLEYSTTYFWGVKITKPAEGLLSVFTFTTTAAPVEISPPARPEAVSPAITPIWVWLIIGICVALLTAVIILLFRTRQM
jgi:hypothetical protein